MRGQRLLPNLHREGPLADRYPAAVALALLALCPFLVVTTAAQSLEPVLMRDLGLSPTALELTAGLANAGYAFGAVAAAQLVQRLPLRVMLLVFEVGFVVGSILAATGGPALFITGRILQGIVTGMMLVAALPPLIVRFGAAKIPSTAMVINIGLFGVVALGPLVGGLVAETGLWRLFLWVLAALGAAGLAFGLATYEHQEPANPELPIDSPAITLAALGCGLAFAGVSVLVGGGFGSVLFLALVGSGVASLVALLILEYRRPEPLMPVGQLSSTLPVAGIVGAMAAGGAAVALISIIQVFLTQVEGLDALAAGARFWPMIVGVVLSAGALAVAVRTRWLPVLAMGGILVTVVAGVVVLMLEPGGPEAIVLLATFLVGLGTGASVAPGLFTAAFSVPSAEIGRTFALVELLRSAAAFLLAPVVLHIAMAGAGDGPQALADGLRTAAFIAVAVTVLAAIAVAALFFAGGARLRPPRIAEWLRGEATALDSPALGGAARGRSGGAAATDPSAS